MQQDLFQSHHQPQQMEELEQQKVEIHPSWYNVLKEEFEKEYFQEIKTFIKEEIKQGQIIYPPGRLIFNAFNTTPFDEVKVVVLGQDPYHGINQAHGLCFSVNHGVKPPPSLVNIFKELEQDLGFKIPTHGNLEHWAKQGVFLLNAVLTVKANTPASHKDIGWMRFTDAVIQAISAQKENIVFLLWGKFAQEKAALIDQQKHLILKAAHPSPFSAYSGFFGCRHFSKANKFLISKKVTPVNWQL